MATRGKTPSLPPHHGLLEHAVTIDTCVSVLRSAGNLFGPMLLVQAVKFRSPDSTAEHTVVVGPKDRRRLCLYDGLFHQVIVQYKSVPLPRRLQGRHHVHLAQHVHRRCAVCQRAR